MELDRYIKGQRVLLGELGKGERTVTDMVRVWNGDVKYPKSSLT